ncbi:MAG: HEAT repeat domain-containing protein [Deltaproteobacteria bacterium]|nr:HEAT repeat domain-containing protein [Deltaproteobacteria bacterium]
MSARRQSWRCGLLLALCAWGGCRCDHPRSTTRESTALVVREIHVAVAGLSDLPETTVETWLKRYLNDAGYRLDIGSESPSAYRLSAQLARQQARTLLVISARASDDLQVMPIAWQEIVVGADKDPSAMFAGAWRRWLARARIVEGRNDLTTLGAALRAKDPETRAWAVEVAGFYRLRHAVPLVIERLRDKQRSVADTAIGALVAIGDRQAVKSLTALAEFRDTERLAQLIDAIGQLGGSEARGFLEFIAGGHEDADLRRMAQQALARMARQGDHGHSAKDGKRSR